MKKQYPDLLNDNVSRLFRKYLVPSISATLVTSIYILADTLMIGRGVGSLGIAALNILLPLFSLFFATGMMFGVGGSVLFSVAKGRGDEKAAKEHFTAALAGAFVMAVFYEVTCNLFFDPITAVLGRNEAMDALVREYGRILVAGAPVFMASSFLQAFVRNDKAPKKAMAAVISGGVLNVVLDYLFIFPMGMGMAGGAIATVIGSGVTVAILLSHFLSPHNTLKLTRQFHPKQVFEALGNGLSSFVVDLSSGIVIFLFNRQLLAYVGDLGVVVYGIISNSALIVNSVCNGICQASQPIMAVNFGAGKRDRVEQTRRLALGTAFAAGTLFAVLGILSPGLLVEIFVEPTPEITEMAVPAVRIYFVGFVATGMNLLFATYFQSVLKPGSALALSLARGMVFNAALVFLLPVFLGVTGIWATMPVTEAATLALGLFLLFRGRKPRPAVEY